jgi:nitrite reductase/ring-hydroxylating ferredoxin subunit
VRDGTIVCPWHESQYALTDGHVVHGPSTYDQPCYAVRITDGFVEVQLA